MNGRTPDAVYTATLVEKRIVPEEELNAVTLRHDRLVKVGRNGVKFAKRTYGLGDPTLASFFDQYVEVRSDPTDITWVSIWSEQGVHLCDVDWNKRAIFGAMNEQEYNQANRTRQRHNKALRDVSRREMRIIEDPTEIILQDAKEQLEQQGYRPPDPPAEVMKIVRTGLQPPSESQPLRIAVGAESMSPQRPAIDWSQFADDDSAVDDSAIALFTEDQ